MAHGGSRRSSSRARKRRNRLSGSTVALVGFLALVVAFCGWLVLRPPPVGESVQLGEPVSREVDQQAAPTETRTLLVVGDSWTTGGTMNSGPEWPALLNLPAEWNVLTDAAGGSGYIGDHANSALTHGGRLKRILRDNEPDVVVVAMGRNDIQHDPAAVQRIARADLTAMRDRWPDAEIVVFSPFSPVPPIEVTTTLTATLSDLADDLGMPFVDVSDIIGNRAELITRDHPNDAGHERLAAVLTPALLELGVLA